MQATVVIGIWELVSSSAPPSSDADLARAVVAGAQGAEASLFLRFAQRVRLYGLRHLRDEDRAGDLVHDVLLRVLEALRAGRLENPESLASFVLGTCRHVVWDLRRAEARERKIREEAAVFEDAVEMPPLTEVDRVRLANCLQALPERDSQVIRMSFLEDRSADDIAERIGVTSGNVRVIRHRALARLGQCVGAVA